VVWYKRTDVSDALVASIFCHEDGDGKKTSAGFNRLTPNDPYIGRTAPLTCKRYI